MILILEKINHPPVIHVQYAHHTMRSLSQLLEFSNSFLLTFEKKFAQRQILPSGVLANRLSRLLRDRTQGLLVHFGPYAKNLPPRRPKSMESRGFSLRSMCRGVSTLCTVSDCVHSIPSGFLHFSISFQSFLEMALLLPLVSKHLFVCIINSGNLFTRGQL